ASGAFAPVLSADARFVAFQNSVQGISEYDRLTGETVSASVASDGAEGHGYSLRPSLSADGRFLAFSSAAPDLGAGDTNGTYDVSVRARVTGETVRVIDPNGFPSRTALSADGRFVAFGDGRVFVHDRLIGETATVSVASNGTEGHGY